MLLYFFKFVEQITRKKKLINYIFEWGEKIYPQVHLRITEFEKRSFLQTSKFWYIPLVY